MSALAALLERVKSAAGPDRALDDDVLFATGHRFSVAFVSGTGWRWRGADLAERDLPLTASLDAAVALVERTLPGWVWSAGNLSTGGQAYLMRREGAQLIGGSARSPALALVAARLEALIAQEARE